MSITSFLHLLGFLGRSHLGLQFGVCAPGGTSPICAVDPGSVPKAMDVLTPAGVSQAAELDPTAPPVEIAGVPVP